MENSVLVYSYLSHQAFIMIIIIIKVLSQVL